MSNEQPSTISGAIKAVTIVKEEATGTSQVNHKLVLTDEVKDALCNNNAANTNVVMIAIAGSCRKGKSYFMTKLKNYFDHLRVTTSQDEQGQIYDSTDFQLPAEGDPGLFRRFTYAGEKKDWLDAHPNKPNYFHSERGSYGITSGIDISQPIPVRQGHETVSVVLLDTEGCFDATTNSTFGDNVHIFALTTLVCSTLIYNISQHIQERDLSNLQYFLEFAQFAKDRAGTAGSKPLQHLLFLVRDWQNPYEYAYGMEGGQRYIDRLLGLQGRGKEHQLLRRRMRDCIGIIECCLLPDPGKAVKELISYSESKPPMDEDFRKTLKNSIPTAFARDKLLVKELAGQPDSLKVLYDLFAGLVKIFSDGKTLPKPQTQWSLMCTVHNSGEIDNIVDAYRNELSQLRSTIFPIFLARNVRRVHDDFMNKVSINVNSATFGNNSETVDPPKQSCDKVYNIELRGDADIISKSKDRLVSETDKLLDEFRVKNNRRKIPYTTWARPVTGVGGIGTTATAGLVYFGVIAGGPIAWGVGALGAVAAVGGGTFLYGSDDPPQHGKDPLARCADESS